MIYCRKCLQPDTRPGIVFNEDGVCYACLYEEKKLKINWDKRNEELKEIADWARKERRERGNYYDCVIGVSGGKDSTFQAVYAKEKLGLRPLLVNCASGDNTEAGVYNLDNLGRISGGFDIISIRVNPNIARKLSKKCFYEKGNLMAASEYCLWSSAFRIAYNYNIPLVIQGENAALTLGTAERQDTSGNAFNVVDLNTIDGFDVEKLISGTDIDIEDMYPYQMPSINDMKKRGIRAIWLQYYVKEWSQTGNADFAVARGLRGRTDVDLHDLGWYRIFASVDSDVNVVNQMIKYLKFGFGATTDQVCYDIREGRLSREEAKWYVKEYDGKCGECFIDKACDYIGISKDEFWAVVDRFVNTDLFYKDEFGKWKPKFTVGE